MQINTHAALKTRVLAGIAQAEKTRRCLLAGHVDDSQPETLVVSLYDLGRGLKLRVPYDELDRSGADAVEQLGYEFARAFILNRSWYQVQPGDVFMEWRPGIEKAIGLVGDADRLGPNQWFVLHHAEVGNSNVEAVARVEYVEPPPRPRVPEKLDTSHTIIFEQQADGTITVDKMDLYVTGAPYTVEHNVTPGKELESTIKFDHSETIGRLEKGCE